MEFSIEEKFDLLENKYLPMIIEAGSVEVSFEEFLDQQPASIIGEKIYKNGFWYLITY